MANGGQRRSDECGPPKASPAHTCTAGDLRIPAAGHTAVRLRPPVITAGRGQAQPRLRRPAAGGP
eukprot:12659304-Alexandrium_andersonii.AAC.1